MHLHHGRPCFCEPELVTVTVAITDGAGNVRAVRDGSFWLYRHGRGRHAAE
jgi:hypothetical protein